MALIDFSKAKPQLIENQQKTPTYKYNTVLEGDEGDITLDRYSSRLPVERF